jgi:hypothetical protein
VPRGEVDAKEPPAAGSNSAAEARGTSTTPERPMPPATSTFPFDRSADANLVRAAGMADVAVNAPLVGSKISAEARMAEPELPPAISTRPSCRRIAEWPCRAVFMRPAVAVKAPVPGS